LNDSELNILTINGLYGYRVGIFGWLMNICSLYLSKNNNPVNLQKFLNYIIKDNSEKLLANDFEILSFAFSLIIRGIPLINYGNWDPKEILIKNTKLINATPNISLPKIYNLNSLYLLSPIFDSGCAIYSNKTPYSSGFEKWTLWNNIEFNDKKFNKGMVWSFFKSENTGIMVITLNLHESESSLIYNMQMYQIVKLKKQLEETFSKDLERYETYITGDFKSEFNSISDPEMQYRLNILNECNLKIINSSKDLLNTHFMFYSSNCSQHTSISDINLFDDQFINVNFTNDTYNDVKISVPEDKDVPEALYEDVPQIITEHAPDVVIDCIPDVVHDKVEVVSKDEIIITDYFDKKGKVEDIKKQKDENSTNNSEWLFL
jgi:hypothetical protein